MLIIIMKVIKVWVFNINGLCKNFFNKYDFISDILSNSSRNIQNKFGKVVFVVHKLILGGIENGKKIFYFRISN